MKSHSVAQFMADRLMAMKKIMFSPESQKDPDSNLGARIGFADHGGAIQGLYA